MLFTGRKLQQVFSNGDVEASNSINVEANYEELHYPTGSTHKPSTVDNNEPVKIAEDHTIPVTVSITYPV